MKHISNLNVIETKAIQLFSGLFEIWIGRFFKCLYSPVQKSFDQETDNTTFGDAAYDETIIFLNQLMDRYGFFDESILNKIQNENVEWNRLKFEVNDLIKPIKIKNTLCRYMDCNIGSVILLIFEEKMRALFQGVKLTQNEVSQLILKIQSAIINNSATFILQHDKDTELGPASLQKKIGNDIVYSIDVSIHDEDSFFSQRLNLLCKELFGIKEFSISNFDQRMRAAITSIPKQQEKYYTQIAVFLLLAKKRNNNQIAVCPKMLLSLILFFVTGKGFPTETDRSSMVAFYAGVKLPMFFNSNNLEDSSSKGLNSAESEFKKQNREKNNRSKTKNCLLC